MSAYETGYRAAANGAKLSDCPFKDIASKLEWSRGFHEGSAAKRLVEFLQS